MIVFNLCHDLYSGNDSADLDAVNTRSISKTAIIIVVVCI